MRRALTREGKRTRSPGWAGPVDQPKQMVSIRFEKLIRQTKDLWFARLATEGFHLSRSNH